MFLEFHKRRRAALKGDYLYVIGAGKSVTLKMGVPQEVDDQVGHLILARDSDMVRLVEPPKKKKKAKKVKMMPEDKVVEA